MHIVTIVVLTCNLIHELYVDTQVHLYFVIFEMEKKLRSIFMEIKGYHLPKEKWLHTEA